jgi:hypothetical protein
MQTSYSVNKAVALLGQLIDSSFKFTASGIASEAVKIGRAVMKVPGQIGQVRNTQPNYNTLTASADISASNVNTITVNGVASTAVTYASSHAATMAAIVVAVLANAKVANCWLDTTDNKIIHIITFDATATITGATTGGSAVTWAAGTAGVRASDFYGVAELSAALEGAGPNEDNAATAAAETMVNVLRRGRMAVKFETAFNIEKDTLYVRHTVNGSTVVGDFRNTSDTNRATSLSGYPIKVLESLSAAGIGFIEINLP